MPSYSKLLMLLSTPFPLRPSAAIRIARHSRLPPSVTSHSRLLSSATSPKLRLSIRASEQVHTQEVSKEGCGEIAISYPGVKDPHSWPEWSKLADHLLSKGYSKRSVIPGVQDDSIVTDKDLPEEFLRAAAACLDFARERPDLLRLLTKKYIKLVVENVSPFLFKDGEKSASRMRSFLSGDGSTAMELGEAQTIDIMYFLLSYIYKPYPTSNGNQLKDNEPVETSVRKLLLELFNFSGTFWRSKLAEAGKTELPLGNEQFSRPSGKSIEMKRGDWICQKCTFMNFARNTSCLECGEARPKRQLTGAEWECPQCDFFNYGRNKSCLRCDHMRPLDAQNVSVSSQDSHGGNSTRLESDNASDSISRSLDRILGRSSSSRNLLTNEDSNASTSGSFSSSQFRQNTANSRRSVDDVPFVPLPPDMFRKTHESNSDVQQSSDKEAASSPKTSDLIDSLFKSSEKSVENSNNKELSDDDFPDIMPIRKGENRFVVSKKKDRSLTSPAYKRRLAMEQENNYNSVPFVPFPPGYFAKKDDQPADVSTETNANFDKDEALSKKLGAEKTKISDNGGRNTEDSYKTDISGFNLNQNNFNSGSQSSPPSNLPRDSIRETSNQTLKNSAFEKNSPHDSSYDTTYHMKPAENSTRQSTKWNNNSYDEPAADSSQPPASFGRSTVKSTRPSDGSWRDDRGYSSSEYANKNSVSVSSPQQSSNNNAYSGKSLEGSCVKEIDPLDMSEEAKAERWFRRAAQIKDISELSNIPDEDFPEIMPMRKGVNRFVVSKRKTPLERRLTSPQYRRNLPSLGSESDKDVGS